MIDFGIVRPGTTLYIPFATYDSNDPSASVTLTGLATTDIEVYKNGTTTQRSSDNGYALLDTDGIDFDSITGVHGISIDLADNSDAGFYAAGAQYTVVVSSVTVDAATINFIAATFRIGYPQALLNTTIATLASQTSFTLTAGPAEDDALNGCVVCIHDVASAVQCGFAVVQDYTGASKTVTLAAGTTFTAAASDNISFFPPANVSYFGGTGGTFASGRPEVNTTHIAGSAVSTSSAQIGVNVVNAGGTAWGSGAITAGSIAADAITAAKIADGAIDSGTFAAGAITASAIAADAIGASELAADAVAEIADAVWDEATSGHTTAGTTGKALTDASSAGDPWSTALPGAYGAGTAGKIIGDNINATVSSRASQTTADAIETDTQDIQSRIPAALTAGGNIKADALAISGDTTAADNLEAACDGNTYNVGGGAVVAASVTGAVGSVTGNVGGNVTGSVGSVTGNVGGNVTGSIGSLAAQAKADVNAEADTALTDYDPPTRTEATSDKDAILAQLPSSPTKNAAFTYVIKMVASSDHVTPKTGLTVTMTRSIDGAAFASATGTVTEISTGHYKVAASAADMNGDVVTHRFTGTDADDLTMEFQTVS